MLIFKVRDLPPQSDIHVKSDTKNHTYSYEPKMASHQSTSNLVIVIKNKNILLEKMFIYIVYIYIYIYIYIFIYTVFLFLSLFGLSLCVSLVRLFSLMANQTLLSLCACLALSLSFLSVSFPACIC